MEYDMNSADTKVGIWSNCVSLGMVDHTSINNEEQWQND